MDPSHLSCTHHQCDPARALTPLNPPIPGKPSNLTPYTSAVKACSDFGLAAATMDRCRASQLS
jgi:hypothetical protein